MMNKATRARASRRRSVVVLLFVCALIGAVGMMPWAISVGQEGEVKAAVAGPRGAAMSSEVLPTRRVAGPDIKVPSVLQPIEHWLSECEGSFFLTSKSHRDFTCMNNCPKHEPELERQFLYYQNSTYSAARLLQLCEREYVPVLVRISRGFMYWRKCTKGKLGGSHEFRIVRRVLFFLWKQVMLPDVVFAFDPSDYSRPLTPMTEGVGASQWNFFEPGIVRFVGDPASPSLLFPTKAFIKTTGLCNLEKAFNDVLTPCSNVNPTPWNSKKPVLFFRGSPTGIPLDQHHEHFLPRTAFSERFRELPGYDIAFAVDAVPPYRTPEFRARHRWEPRVPKQDYALYKYLISMDGHTASWGLIERLATGSLVFKQESSFREFYYIHLEPWVHYIPVDPGFANLEVARRWALEHDEEARAMAQNTLDLIAKRFRTQDMFCYVFRLILELSRRFDAAGTDILFDDDANTWQVINRADVD